MSSLNSLSPELVCTAIESNHAAVSEAFQRAFGVAYDFSAGAQVSPDANQLPPDFAGPGLVLVFLAGEIAAAAAIPESSGLLPEWCSAPDPARQDQLRALAAELGGILFPTTSSITDCLVAYVGDIAGGIRQSELAPSCAGVALTVGHDGRTGLIHVLWPIANPRSVVGDGVQAASSTSDDTPVDTARAAPLPQRRPRIPYRDMEDGLRLLPPYARSLMKIQVPVTVILAEAKQPLHTILSIGPGTIIHFNKSCEDTLTLEVAGRKFAVGETVKVGDKFGLWITSIILPDERFWVIGGRGPAQRVR